MKATDENTSLVQLALVEKNFASIALPLLHESLQITSFSQLAKVVRHKKKKLSKETEETKNLSIRFVDLALSRIKSWLICSLHSQSHVNSSFRDYSSFSNRFSQIPHHVCYRYSHFSHDPSPFNRSQSARLPLSQTHFFVTILESHPFPTRWRNLVRRSFIASRLLAFSRLPFNRKPPW